MNEPRYVWILRKHPRTEIPSVERCLIVKKTKSGVKIHRYYAVEFFKNSDVAHTLFYDEQSCKAAALRVITELLGRRKSDIETLELMLANGIDVHDTPAEKGYSGPIELT